MPCMTPEELLVAALRTDADEAATARHLEECGSCRERVRETREVAAAMHSLPGAAPGNDCLDDETIAEQAEGTREDDQEALAHLAGCSSCRARLAGVVRLIDDATIRSAIGALQRPPRFTLHRPSRRAAVSVGLIAAAAVIVLLGPLRSRVDTSGIASKGDSLRDPAITTTAAPRILSPTSMANASDSLRWTIVPHADLYRIRVWNAEGLVVWTTDTRDTAVQLPAVLRPATLYLWEVRARTGWDRWVSSDLAELTLRSGQQR